MKNFLLTWVGSAIALLITDKIVEDFSVKNFTAALVAAAVIGLVNAFIRPILSLFAFPITLLTFGLFTFVINAISLWLASELTPGDNFRIQGFGAAFIGSIVLTIVSSVVNYFLNKVI